MQHLLALVKENGWQRCYACWRLVELVHGCNHMTWVVFFIFIFIFLMIEN